MSAGRRTRPVLQTPERVAGALAGLRMQRGERIRRPVEKEARTRHAIDTVVRALGPERTDRAER